MSRKGQNIQPKYTILPEGIKFIYDINRSLSFISRHCGFSTLILVKFMKSYNIKDYYITEKMLILFKKRYKNFEEGIHYIKMLPETINNKELEKNNE